MLSYRSIVDSLWEPRTTKATDWPENNSWVQRAHQLKSQPIDHKTSDERMSWDEIAAGNWRGYMLNTSPPNG